MVIHNLRLPFNSHQEIINSSDVAYHLKAFNCAVYFFFVDIFFLIEFIFDMYCAAEPI